MTIIEQIQAIFASLGITIIDFACLLYITKTIIFKPLKYFFIRYGLGGKL